MTLCYDDSLRSVLRLSLPDKKLKEKKAFRDDRSVPRPHDLI